MKVQHIAVANNKGGAAKTTTVIHVAQAFAEKGKRVIVIDGDKNGTCRSWARRRGNAEPFPVLSIREVMKYESPKDIVLYDTEGGISSDEIKELTGVCDYIIIPCKPDVYNMEATEKMAREFINQGINFRVLISDAMWHGNYMRATQLKNYFIEQGIPCFDQMIPHSAKVTDAGDQGKTVSNISGARYISDRFVEVVEQIQKDLSGTQSETKPAKPSTFVIDDDDIDLLNENITTLGGKRHGSMEVRA